MSPSENNPITLEHVKCLEHVVHAPPLSSIPKIGTISLQSSLELHESSLYKRGQRKGADAYEQWPLVTLVSLSNLKQVLEPVTGIVRGKAKKQTRSSVKMGREILGYSLGRGTWVYQDAIFPLVFIWLV